MLKVYDSGNSYSSKCRGVHKSFAYHQHFDNHDELANLLVAACLLLENEQNLKLETELWPQELKAWWDAHKQDYEDVVNKEKLMKSGLSKLTPEERKALGLKKLELEDEGDPETVHVNVVGVKRR